MKTLTCSEFSELIWTQEEVTNIDFCLNKCTDNTLEGFCKIGVLDFADSTLVIGNYYGGGDPFCYDLTTDDDSSGLYCCLKNWLSSMECDFDPEKSDFVIYIQERKEDTSEEESPDPLECAQMSFENGTRFCIEDFDNNESLYNEYLELMELGPVGFYEEYKDSLDFDEDFVTEYGDYYD